VIIICLLIGNRQIEKNPVRDDNYVAPYVGFSRNAGYWYGIIFKHGTQYVEGGA